MAEQTTLTVEYALTRREIFRSFLQSMTRSPKFLGTIIFHSIAIGIIILLTRATILRSLTLKDAIIAAAWALGFLIIIPIWTSIRGKTAKRTLTVSSKGISTAIGRIKGQVPWDKVRVINDSAQFVLIVRTNGNAFFIPQRAFSGPEQRSSFATAIRSWKHADTKQPETGPQFPVTLISYNAKGPGNRSRPVNFGWILEASDAFFAPSL
jgi:hypothetical protein